LSWLNSGEFSYSQRGSTPVEVIHEARSAFSSRQGVLTSARLHGGRSHRNHTYQSLVPGTIRTFGSFKGILVQRRM